MSDNNDPVVPVEGQPAQAVIDTEKKEGTPANQPDPNVSKIIADRDRNFQKAKDLETKVSEIEGRQDYQDAMRQKAEYLNSVAKENNLTERERKLLDRADSEDSAKEIVADILDYRKETEQEALRKIQEVDVAPRYTPESAAEKLENLKDSGRLDEAIEIQLNTKR
jgi:hypothetical protein